jgi:small-conductance mechanosensitive channel
MRRFCFVALWLGLIWAGCAAAQPQPPADPAAVERELRDAQTALSRNIPDAELTRLRERALDLEAQMNAAADALGPQLTATRAKLDELGPPPKGTPEAPDIRAQRQTLTAQAARLDAAAKRSRLVALEAEQVADRASELRRSRFNAEISSRSAGLLSPAFWRDMAASAPADLRRLGRGWTTFRAGAGGASGAKLAGLALGLAWALVLLFPVRHGIERLARRRLATHTPATRLRRSSLAVFVVVVGALTPLLAIAGLVQSVIWTGALPPGSRAAEAALTATAVGAYVTALGRALLLPGRESWRLLDVPETTAWALRRYPAAAGLAAAFGAVLDLGGRAAGLSLPASVAAGALATVVYCVVGAAFLLQLGRIRRRAAAPSPWWALTICAWAVLLTALGALVSGYLALAGAITRQAVWAGIVAGTAYLLVTFVDDAARTLLNGESGFGRRAALSLGVRPVMVDQAGVLVSGALRVVLLLLAVGLIIVPFGGEVSGLTDGLQRAVTGFSVGGTRISLGAVATALFCFVLGVGLARAFQRWLERTYLPTTDLDVGLRHSLSTLVGYCGLVAAVVWSVSALGVSMQRLALVASALSVGIGFGLQAIVQNFVSGLILLAERPVKVGDWISVGGQEGDVRRINVRATEIQTPDRSTLLVPNSELITKTVLNRTLAAPIGRVQIDLDVDLASDPAVVRDAILGAFTDEPAVLRQPEPAVFLDAVLPAGLHFKAFAHVAGPRDAYPVRSRLLFDILARFRDRDVRLARPDWGPPGPAGPPPPPAEPPRMPPAGAG